jgi:hypothetical protein
MLPVPPVALAPPVLLMPPTLGEEPPLDIPPLELIEPPFGITLLPPLVVPGPSMPAAGRSHEGNSAQAATARTKLPSTEIRNRFMLGSFAFVTRAP